MIVVLDTLGLLATAALFGSMAFFSAVMAPLIFIKLEAATAGAFIRQVFPWYYIVIGVLSSLGVVSFALVRPGDAVILGAVALGAYVSRQQIMPRINRERDLAKAGEAAAEDRFNRLHRVSVWINGAQLIGVLAVLLRFAVT